MQLSSWITRTDAKSHLSLWPAFPNFIQKLWALFSFKILYSRNYNSLLNTKVLFIFRCSKNWQKKSVHHHLLANDGAHFFLPIFTAAKDEKYFINLIFLSKEQTTLVSWIRLRYNSKEKIISLAKVFQAK